jgi:hypothetical protein
MQRFTSWKTNSIRASQEISAIYGTRRFSIKMFTRASQRSYPKPRDSVHILKSHSFKIHLYVILPHMYVSQLFSFLQVFLSK